MHIAPIGANINFTSTTQTKENKDKKHINPVKLTGNLTIGLLGVTAITGYANCGKAHAASVFLTAGAALAHIISLNKSPNGNKKDFVA